MARKARKTIGHIVRYATLYGLLLTGTATEEAYRRTNNYLDTKYAEQWAAEDAEYEKKREFNERVGNAFGDIAHTFYDPEISDTRSGNIRFYNLPPNEILKRLREAKGLVNKHRKLLAEAGFEQKIMEDQLDVGIRNVGEFVADWPKDASTWYEYLYAGDDARPPRTYAQEIKSFFERSEELRQWVLSQGEPKKYSIKYSIRGLRDFMIITSVVTTPLVSLIGCSLAYESLKRRYKYMISREHLDEKLARLRDAFESTNTG